MAIVNYIQGGNTCISNVEYSMTGNVGTIQANTTNGVYQVFVDTSAMLLSNTVQLRIYEKVWSGGTQRVIYETNLVDVQQDPIWVSPSLVLMHGWDATANSQAGANVYLQWSIRRVA
jgi:hypothetical protein